MLDIDEFGNKVPEKNYVDLTTRDLSRIAESIAVRLHLFNGEYPAFMPQAVRAVMEHPNLLRADYDKLDTFAKMFELDWRGDRTVPNKKEPLASHPVYLTIQDRSNFARYGEVGNFELLGMLRQACVPFLEQLTDDLVKESQSSQGSSTSTTKSASKTKIKT